MVECGVPILARIASYRRVNVAAIIPFPAQKQNVRLVAELGFHTNVASLAVATHAGAGL